MCITVFETFEISDVYLTIFFSYFMKEKKYHKSYTVKKE